MAIAPAPRILGAVERVLDRLAEHELMPEEPHRLLGGGAHRRHAEALAELRDDAFRRLARMHDADRHAERPGRGGDEPALAVARGRVLPVAARQLVLDQPVLRRRVGNAKQRFGQRHQRQPLLGGEAVIVHEVLEPADTAARMADRLDVALGARRDGRLLAGRMRGLLEKPRDDFFVGRRIVGFEGGDRTAAFGILLSSLRRHRRSCRSLECAAGLGSGRVPPSFSPPEIGYGPPRMDSALADELDEARRQLAAIPGFSTASAEIARLERLPGLTNRVYKVELPDGRFALRIPGAGTAAIIDRRTEETNARAAAAAGVAPEVIHFGADGVMLTRFVDGEPLTRERIAAPGALERAGSDAPPPA